MLALVTGAFLVGRASAQHATWHTVTLDLAGVAADEQTGSRIVSLTDGNWTYSVEDTVAWIDDIGAYHDSGWPSCLEPRHPGSSDRSHEKVTIRFASVVADTEYVKWSPVVLVDCKRDSNEE